MPSTPDNPFEEASDADHEFGDPTDVNFVRPDVAGAVDVAVAVSNDNDNDNDNDDGPATIVRTVIRSLTNDADDDEEDALTIKQPSSKSALPQTPVQPIEQPPTTPTTAALPRIEQPQAVRPVAPAARVTSPSLSRPSTMSGDTGFVVHRAADAAATVPPSIMSAPAPVAKASVLEALTSLKKSTVSTSIPIVRPPAELSGPNNRASSLTSGSMAAVKPEVLEALAALKPATSSLSSQSLSSLSSTSLPVARPREATSPSLTSGEVAVPKASAPRGPPVMVAPETLRQVALAVGAVVAMVIFMLIAPTSTFTPVKVQADLPVIQLPATGLPCERLESRRRVLSCFLPRRSFFALPTQERTSRIEVSRGLARTAGFETTQLVDLGGVWREVPSVPPPPPPARLPVIATTPVVEPEPPSTSLPLSKPPTTK